MPTIAEVLHRRSDLSTFLVHLTKTGGEDALHNLCRMLTEGRIEARTAMGWAAKRATDLGPIAADSQRVVCFSEAPLEQVYSLGADIAGRREKLEPYGLVFTKIVARRKGANPIWYVDMSPSGRVWVIRDALAGLLEEAVALGEEGFARHHAAAIFPFAEQMGTWPSLGTQKEFWWEREWRHVGPFTFNSDELALILAPEKDHEELAKVSGRPIIDAAWSLERMIAHLARISPEDVTPFSVGDRTVEAPDESPFEW